jgi:hypothetical protein
MKTFEEIKKTLSSSSVSYMESAIEEYSHKEDLIHIVCNQPNNLVFENTDEEDLSFIISFLGSMFGINVETDEMDENEYQNHAKYLYDMYLDVMA